MKTWFAAAFVASMLAGAVQAQDVPAPIVPPEPSPTIAASQAGSSCIPSFVPPGGRCRVSTLAGVGQVGGVDVDWALYDIQSAGVRHGVALLLAPDAADPSQLRAMASLPTPGGAVDRWERSPYGAAGIVSRDGVDYAGIGIRGEAGLALFSLQKVEAGVWTPVDSSRLSAELDTRIAALAKPGCRINSGGMDWRNFRVRHGLMGDQGSCGTVMLDLGVKDGAVAVTDALIIR